MRYSSPPVDAPKNQPASFSASSGINPNPNLYTAGQAGPQHRGQPQAQGYVQGYPGQNPAGHGHAPGQADAFGFGAWGNMNDATAQMGVQFGKSAVAAGQDYVEKNVSATSSSIVVRVSRMVCNRNKQQAGQWSR